MGYTAIVGFPFAVFYGIRAIWAFALANRLVGSDDLTNLFSLFILCGVLAFMAHVSAIAAASVSIAAWCEGCKNDSKRNDGDFSVGGAVVVATGTGQKVFLSGGYVYGGIGTGAVSGAGYGGNEAVVGAGYGGNEAVVGAGYDGAQTVVGAGYGGAEAVVGTNYGGNEAILGTNYSGTQAALVGGSA